jgi:hypothetical protein
VGAPAPIATPTTIRAAIGWALQQRRGRLARRLWAPFAEAEAEAYRRLVESALVFADAEGAARGLRAANRRGYDLVRDLARLAETELGGHRTAALEALRASAWWRSPCGCSILDWNGRGCGWHSE